MSTSAPNHPEADATVRSYSCVPCEVNWKSTDPTCWMCGRSTSEDAALPNTTRGVPTDEPAAPVSRWGSNFLEAQALGLPDPRAPKRRPAA